MPNLFDSLELGDITLPNRIIMAPLTRTRAGVNHIPNELMAEYYAQRATAGLIITEAVSVDPMGVGYPNTPGIWSEEQIEGWKLITKAVHNAGGRIVAQLWHVGRISDPFYLDGKLPLAPSSIAAKGHVSLLRPERSFVTPHALTLDEITEIISKFRRAAINAEKSGFDGITIHSANGYLIDQFLQDSTNHRTDEYGGSLENRTRFMLDITKASIEIWGSKRIGIHLAPRCDAHDMGDSNPLKTFTYAVQELGKLGIAFLSVRESLGENRIGLTLRKNFSGVYIANEGFTKETANMVLNNQEADAVAFGKLFIANPDLVKRFKLNLPLNQPDPSKFYGNDAKGYTDYSFYNDQNI